MTAFIVGLACWIVGIVMGGYAVFRLNDAAYRDVFRLYQEEREARIRAEFDLTDERGKRI